MLSFFTLILYALFTALDHHFDNFLTFLLLNIFENYYMEISKLTFQKIEQCRLVHLIFRRLQVPHAITEVIRIKFASFSVPVHLDRCHWHCHQSTKWVIHCITLVAVPIDDSFHYIKLQWANMHLRPPPALSSIQSPHPVNIIPYFQLIPRAWSYHHKSCR